MEALRRWLSHPLQVRRPEPLPPTPPGLAHFVKEADGTYTRFHLRVAPDGSGILLANASAAVRLTPSGVVIAKDLLEGKAPEAVVQEVAARFRGAAPETVGGDVAEVRALIDRLLSPGTRYPILNLEDPEASARPAQLMAPFTADLPLADPVRLVPLLNRLWDAGFVQAVFLAPDSPSRVHLARAVERAEDLGMIAGVRARASDLISADLVRDLAGAGLDYLILPAASPGREVHDGLFGEGDHALIERAFATAQASELCAMAEVPLVETTLPTLEPMIEWLGRLGIGEVSFFAVAAPDDMPEEKRSGALPASMLPQAGALVEGAARDARIRFFWQPPVRRDPDLPLSQQVREGPRCSGDLAVRVELDGSVIPPRGPYRVAGNLLREPWSEIWDGPEFRSFRDRVQAPTRCPDCPGLAMCAPDCLRDPRSWAEPGD